MKNEGWTGSPGRLRLQPGPPSLPLALVPQGWWLRERSGPGKGGTGSGDQTWQARRGQHRSDCTGLIGVVTPHFLWCPASWQYWAPFLALLHLSHRVLLPFPPPPPPPPPPPDAAPPPPPPKSSKSSSMMALIFSPPTLPVSSSVIPLLLFCPVSSYFLLHNHSPRHTNPHYRATHARAG